AAQLPGTRLIHSIKTLKNMWQIMFGNANARVLDFKINLTVVRAPTDGDSPILGSVLYGIVNEVVENLVDGLFIRPGREGRGRAVDQVPVSGHSLQKKFFALSSRAVALHAGLHDRLQEHWRKRESFLT